MKRPLLPSGRRFSFELNTEITSVLLFSPGELAELFSDGLFALDKAGQLFPGVTVPAAGERLLSVELGPVGFARPEEPGSLRVTYEDLMARGQSRPAHTHVAVRLNDAATALQACVMRQRMLIARMRAVEEMTRRPRAIVHVDRDAAEVMITAVSHIAAAVDAAVTRAL
jgi:hypothetical protein